MSLLGVFNLKIIIGRHSSRPIAHCSCFSLLATLPHSHCLNQGFSLHWIICWLQRGKAVIYMKTSYNMHCTKVDLLIKHTNLSKHISGLQKMQCQLFGLDGERGVFSWLQSASTLLDATKSNTQDLQVLAHTPKLLQCGRIVINSEMKLQCEFG